MTTHHEFNILCSLRESSLAAASNGRHSPGVEKSFPTSSTKGSQTERRALFSRKVPCSFLYSPFATTSKSKGFLKIGLSWPLLQDESWYTKLRRRRYRFFAPERKKSRKSTPLYLQVWQMLRSVKYSFMPFSVDEPATTSRSLA